MATLEDFERAERFLRQMVKDLDDRREHFAYSLPHHALEFPSMPALRAAVTGSGSHFFDKDAIAFFNSTISDQLHGGRFFVTGESPGDDEPRRYSVRYVYRYGDKPLQVEVLGEFRGFTTKKAAEDMAGLAASILSVL